MPVRAPVKTPIVEPVREPLRRASPEEPCPAQIIRTVREVEPLIP